MHTTAVILKVVEIIFFLEYAKDLRIIALRRRVQTYKRRAYDKRHRRSYGHRPDRPSKQTVRFDIT
jgi:hypothetical protein